MSADRQKKKFYLSPHKRSLGSTLLHVRVPRFPVSQLSLLLSSQSPRINPKNANPFFRTRSARAKTYNWILPIIIKAFFIFIVRSRVSGYTQTDLISRRVKKKKRERRRSREDSHLISMSVEKCFIVPEMKVAPLTSWELISGAMKSVHVWLVKCAVSDFSP